MKLWGNCLGVIIFVFAFVFISMFAFFGEARSANLPTQEKNMISGSEKVVYFNFNSTPQKIIRKSRNIQFSKSRAGNFSGAASTFEYDDGPILFVYGGLVGGFHLNNVYNLTVEFDKADGFYNIASVYLQPEDVRREQMARILMSVVGILKHAGWKHNPDDFYFIPKTKQGFIDYLSQSKEVLGFSWVNGNKHIVLRIDQSMPTGNEEPIKSTPNNYYDAELVLSKTKH